MGSTVWTYQAGDTLSGCRVSAGNILLAFNEFPPSGVVLYHANEGTGQSLADSSGNNNTGSMSAGNWHPAPWMGDAAIGPSVTVTPASVPPLGTGSWTIELWIFIASSPANGATVNFSQYLGPSGQQAAMSTRRISTMRVQCYLRDNAGHITSITFDSNDTVGKWTHVAMVVESNTLRFYVDGVQRGYRDIMGWTFSAWTKRYWFTDTVLTGLDEIRDSALAVYPGGTTFYPKRYPDSGYWQVAASRAQPACKPGLFTVTLSESLPSGCSLKARLLSTAGGDTGWQTLSGSGTVWTRDFSGLPAGNWYPAVQEFAGGAMNANTPSVSQVSLEWTPTPSGVRRWNPFIMPGQNPGFMLFS